MKKARSILTAIVVGILILGFAVQSVEGIPDNAKIRLIEDKNYWVPEAEIMEAQYNKSLVEGELTLDDLRNSTPTTYGYMRANTPGKKYSLPPSWKHGDHFVTGNSQFLLMSFIHNFNPRWNKDGSWNY